MLIKFTVKIIPIFLCFVVLQGCSSLGEHSISAAQHQWILRGEPILGSDKVHQALPDEDLFALTDEIRDFVDVYIPQGVSDIERARQLHNMLVHPTLLGLHYDPYKTFTAQQAFEQRQANCLTFTALYYSLARYMGLKAYINEVDVPATWDIKGESTYVFFRHVNAKIKTHGGDSIIIDLDMSVYNSRYRQRFISEELAQAQYYNNRGMELLIEKDYVKSFQYLRKALQLAPQLGYLWGNLGTLYRRQGHLDEAEYAYLQALSLDKGDLTTISNMGRLYRQMQMPDKAALYNERAQHFRDGNPYYRYMLAQKFYKKKQHDVALGHIRIAIKKERREASFYLLAEDIYWALGRERDASKMAEKAAALKSGDASVWGGPLSGQRRRPNYNNITVY